MQEAALQFGDRSLYQRGSAATALRTHPGQFLLSAYTMAGHPKSDTKKEGRAGLFLRRDGRYTYVPVSVRPEWKLYNATAFQPTGQHMFGNMTLQELTGIGITEIAALEGSAWEPDEAYVGFQRSVWVVGNLQSVIEPTADKYGNREPSQVTWELLGHAQNAPASKYFTNITNTTTYNYTDNRLFMGECSQLNAITECKYCGYKTFFAICNEGAYRYRGTGRYGGRLPSYNITREDGASFWDQTISSPGNFVHRHAERRRMADYIKYVKYEKFLQLTAAPWETLYLVSNETLYGSVDFGSSWHELLLAGYLGPHGVPEAYTIMYPRKKLQIPGDKRNLGFTSLAVSGATEKQVYVSVQGYRLVGDDEVYVEELESNAVLLGSPSGAGSMGLIFRMLEQTARHGELGLKIFDLASAPPVGKSTLDRIYALTEDSGLHLLDGGSVLPNGGAEFQTATGGTCQDRPSQVCYVTGDCTYLGEKMGDCVLQDDNTAAPYFWTPGGFVKDQIGTWATGNASHGYKSLALPASGSFWVSNKIAVDPGMLYRLSGWVQGRVRARVIPYRGDVSMNHIYTEPAEALAAGAWSQFRVEVMLDIHTNDVQLRFEARDGTPSGVDHIWFGPVVNDVVPDAMEPESAWVRGKAGMNISYTPLPPKPPTMKAFDSSSVTLQWDKPEGYEELEPIISYSIYKRLAGVQHTYDKYEKVASINQVLKETRSHKVTGLIFGTDYSWIIDASTGVGASNRSGPLIAGTGAQLATKPGIATLYGKASSSYITIQFDAPSSDGNTPLLNYKVYTADPTKGVYDAGQLTDASLASKVPGTNKWKASIYNLNTNSFYIFKVSAVNIIGEGPISKVSEMIRTNDEKECNVTMRFYPDAGTEKVPVTPNHPIGTGSAATYKEILELDIARAIGIPEERIDLTRINGRYFSFWIRSLGGDSKVSVEHAKNLLMMSVIDKNSVLHDGMMTYQTDTHFLVFDSVNADLAGARLQKGGPMQRLDGMTGGLIGLGVFVIAPTFHAIYTMWLEDYEARLKAARYKDLYSSTLVADG